jgi:hypothetical protein
MAVKPNLYHDAILSKILVKTIPLPFAIDTPELV